MRRMPSRDATRNRHARTPPDEEAWRPAAGNQAARDDWSALMARSQEGDQRAYLILLKSITPYLRTLARRGGLAADEVEDGVQDVLLTVHAIRHTYDQKRPFAPWLAAIARHRLVDRTRRRIRISARETELTDAHETLATDDANLHERTSDVRRLRIAISALANGQRQAIEMLRLRELSVKEASAITGQSETALKVAVHRAVKRLRYLLDGGPVGA
jgi:RNA polymerase sigma factor (sigma-70 family)